MKSSFVHVIRALIVVPLIAALPAIGWAQDNVIRVSCVDSSGQPISGVKVQIQDTQTAKVKKEDTNRQGIAQFKGMDNGIYRLWGRKDGFEPAFHEFVQVTGKVTETVTLHFKPGDSEKKVYFEDQALNQEAFNLLLEGVNLLQSQKWAEGAEKLQASKAINPSNPDTCFNLAVAYIQQQKWDQAEPELKAAEKLLEMTIAVRRGQNPAPDSPEANMLQALVDSYNRTVEIQKRMPQMKLSMEANAAIDRKDYAAAAATYRELIALNPDDADAYSNLAVALGNDKNFDDAIQAIDKALELRPGDTTFEDLKRRILNNKEAAVIDKAKAITKEGDDLFNNGEYAAALEKYREALPMLPKNIQHALWSAIARAHLKLNQGEESMAAYRKAIELEPDKTEYWEEMAEYYIGRNEYDKGLQVYVDMYKQMSRPLDQGMYALGKEFTGKQKNDWAVAAFNRVLEINPDFAEVYYELGVHYFYDTDEKARAKELLTKYQAIGKDETHLEDARKILETMAASEKARRRR